MALAARPRPPVTRPCAPVALLVDRASIPRRATTHAARAAIKIPPSRGRGQEATTSSSLFADPPPPLTRRTTTTVRASSSPSTTTAMPPSAHQPWRHRLALFALYAAASTAAARVFLPPPTAATLTATVWATFVLAISFMEAWVKFKAPTLTKSAAVDAGRHVFGALNAVEAGLAVGFVAALVRSGAAGPAWRLAGVPLVTLVLDLVHLTPALDARARCLIAAAAGARPPVDPPPPAWLHGVYVFGEVVKVVSLGVFAGKVGGALSAGGAAAAGRALAGGW